MKHSSNTSAASASTSSGASSSPPVPPSHGLRSHLGHLIPKHALFHVRLDIEQLSNVPLIKGEFGVRWKFKGVQSASGLLGKMKGGNKSWSAQAKGKGRAAGVGSGIGVTEEGELFDDGTSTHDSSHTTEDDPYSDLVDSPKSTSNPAFDSLLALDSSISHVNGHSPSSRPPETPTPIVHSVSAAASTLSVQTWSEARGMTPWAQLQNYNVKWAHSLNVVVQMDVHRETSDILPNELKLVIMQRVVHGDPDAPQHPRLGAVYLNLAEYADAGKVTRRYLLRQSKTNATLKLSVELEHVGGEKQYKPPPLRKGEILASVSGILSNNGLFNTRFARELDLYVGADKPEDDSTFPYADKEGQIQADSLATSYGLRTTEHLIEALFNPVASDSADQTPFTYYAPPTSPQLEQALSPQPFDDAGNDSSDPTNGRRSVDSSSSGSFVGSTSEHSSFDPGMAADASTMNSNRHWWQKMRSGSRPATPAASKTSFQPTSPVPPVPVRGG